MRYFLDSEFHEDGTIIDLISIGIVAEDGREFYAENADCDLSRCNDWVKENVIPHLWRNKENRPTGNAWTRDGGRGGLLTRQQIATEIQILMNPSEYGKPEIWGYYADYDWVVFCQLFGKMIDLPKGFPMYCRDIKQWADQLGNPALPVQASTEHHALADARWNREAHSFLTEFAMGSVSA